MERCGLPPGTTDCSSHCLRIFPTGLCTSRASAVNCTDCRILGMAGEKWCQQGLWRKAVEKAGSLLEVQQSGKMCAY